MQAKISGPLATLALVLALAVAFLPALGQAEEATGKAGTFLASLGERAIGVASDAKASPEDRASRIRLLLREGFDVPVIARLVLGKHWRNIDDTQRKAFVDVFEDVMVQQSLTIFGRYSGETFDVKKVGPDQANPKLLAVSTQINRPNGAVAKVDWRLRKRGEDFKIVDIVAEGISMALTLRQEYDSVIQQSGGKIEPLIERLRKGSA